MACYIARHFPTDEYLYQDDNAPVHAPREMKRWKQETILNVWHDPLNHRTLT
jgi:hypothetical protein